MDHAYWNHPRFKTVPCVEWNKRSATTNITSQIQNCAYDFSDIKAEGEPYTQLWNQGVDCRHAVPLVRSHPDTTNVIMNWDPVIRLHTQRLLMKIGSSHTCDNLGPLIKGPWEWRAVNSINGSVCGVIELPGPLHDGQDCELICLSSGEALSERTRASKNPLTPITGYWFAPEIAHHRKHCSNCIRDLDDDNRGSCWLDTDGLYKFVRVMWIEWEDGIAYRKAIGRVAQHYWDNAETKEIDVRLG